jgi:hypothetical protein
MNSTSLKIQESKPEWYQTILLDSITSHSPQLRYTCLSFTTFSRQTVQDISTFEMGIVKSFLTSTAGGKTAEMRQDLLALFSKFLERLKAVVHKNRKIAARLRSKAEKDEFFLEEAKILEKECQEKVDFVVWLYQFSLQGLFPGANITRITNSLSMLQLIASKDLDYPELKCTKQDSAILFWQLVGAFDKQDVLDLIHQQQGFCLDLSTEDLLCKCKELLKCARAKDVESGATICKFLIDRIDTFRDLQEKRNLFEKIFDEFYHLLEIHLMECEKDMNAVKQFPLNGVLASLRYLFDLPDLIF